MSRMAPAAAQALLEGYTVDALGAEAATLPTAIRAATARLNRAARRALGARGDGRYHPLATSRALVRTRNAR